MMKNQPTRSEPMENDEKSVRIETLDEFGSGARAGRR